LNSNNKNKYAEETLRGHDVLHYTSLEVNVPIERETIIERPVRTETTVVSSRSPFGIIGVVIAVIVAVLLIMWVVNGGITSSGDAVNVDLPAVTVTE
jgi:hypothetical protein